MKTCPQCGTTYTDQSLRFCLADGAALDSPDREEPTVISNRRAPVTEVTGGGTNSSALVRTILILAVPVLLAFVVLAAAAGIYYYTRDNAVVSNQTVYKTTDKPSPTPDPETERLKRELANLQKQLDEQKASSANGTSFPDIEDLDLEIRTATVNSPGDGFLALRSEPSSEHGDRLAQIPHGAKINVVSCDSDKVTIGSRRGSWCLVEWSGRAGWVFDAWLSY